ncbi:MAG: anti-sigma factor domain-containing protein, partial [Candidatus Limnocylindrales bacterium]
SADGGGASLAVAQTTMRVAQQADVVRVTLAPADGAQGSGALLYSVASGELAMTVTGLAPIPDGATYACWVEQGGERRKIGVLYMEGADGTWAGKVGGLADLKPGSSFGVSLVPAGSTTGSPVLLGRS